MYQHALLSQYPIPRLKGRNVSRWMFLLLCYQLKRCFCANLHSLLFRLLVVCVSVFGWAYIIPTLESLETNINLSAWASYSHIFLPRVSLSLCISKSGIDNAESFPTWKSAWQIFKNEYQSEYLGLIFMFTLPCIFLNSRFLACSMPTLYQHKVENFEKQTSTYTRYTSFV